jgi:predicted GNAT family acetyltransferase
MLASRPEQIGEVAVNGVMRPIEMDLDGGRIEVRVGDQEGFILLRRRGSVLSLIHTEVAPALRGQGIAEGMTRAGLEYARTHGMTVKPFCPFVRKFIERHPEFQALVDPEFSS